jgi:hypothetical protein
MWQALGLEIKEMRCVLVEDMRRYERRHVKDKAALMDQVYNTLTATSCHWMSLPAPTSCIRSALCTNDRKIPRQITNLQ